MSEVMIREVKVVTTGYAPEFGQTMGLVYNAITPSGTNTFHGQGSYRFQRQPMVELPFFRADARPSRRPTSTSYTADIGGPIIKNRTHFFGGFEHTSAIFGPERHHDHPGQPADRSASPSRSTCRAGEHRVRDRQGRSPDQPGQPRSPSATCSSTISSPPTSEHDLEHSQLGPAGHRFHRPPALHRRPAHLDYRQRAPQRVPFPVRDTGAGEDS